MATPSGSPSKTMRNFGVLAGIIALFVFFWITFVGLP